MNAAENPRIWMCIFHNALGYEEYSESEVKACAPEAVEAAVLGLGYGQSVVDADSDIWVRIA